MPAIRSGRVRAALLLGIFLLMLLGNVLTPYAVDDWAYMHSFATGERLTRFGEIFPSMAGARADHERTALRPFLGAALSAAAESGI